MAEQYGTVFLRYLVEAFSRQDIEPNAHQMVGFLEDLETNGYRIVRMSEDELSARAGDIEFDDVTIPTPPRVRVPAAYDPEAAFFQRLYVVITDDAGSFRTEEFGRSKLSDWTIEPERTFVSALVESYHRDEAMQAFEQWRKGHSTFDTSKKTVDGVTFYYLSDQVPF